MSPNITLFVGAPDGGPTRPNPAKIAFLLEALKLDWDTNERQLGDRMTDHEEGVKGDKYLKINPNGRVPSIIDHANNDYSLWESGAILYYLCEKYDTKGDFFGRTLEEKAQTMLWVCHQVSGLGPFQGQVNWLKFFFEGVYGEKPSEAVKDRFLKETKRLYLVFDQRLAINGDYVALDRPTIADFAYLGWTRVAHFAGIDLANYPNVYAWSERMHTLPFVTSAIDKMPK